MILAFLLVLCGRAFAAADATNDPDPYIGDEELAKLDLDRVKKSLSYPVQRRVTRYHEAAQELWDQDDFDGARERLGTLLSRRLNPMEEAYTLRLLAFVDYAAGDLESAVANFKKVLDLQVMKVKDETRIRFNIAQLNASLQNWGEVIHWIDEWRRYVADPDPLAFYLKSVAYYQLEDFDSSIASIERATAMTADDPKESWLRLQAALYTQRQDYTKALPVLEELMLRFPNRRYWIQVSLLYGAQEKYLRALAVQQIAYAQGYLETSQELVRLARSYLFHDLPYPAAKILSKGLESGEIERNADNYTMLANSWIAAREYDRALDPLATAAEVSADGNLYVRLGQVYMQRERWEEAAKVIERAIKKGGLDNPGNAELLAGICHYNAGRIDDARRYFFRARSFEKERPEADKWIAHLESDSAAS